MKHLLLKMKEKIPPLFYSELNAKSTILFLFIWLVSLLGSNDLLAQHNMNFDNEGSDYQIKANFSGLNTDRCDCSETRSLKAYFGGARNGAAVVNQSSLGTSGSFYIPVGPSHSNNYYWTAHYDGSQQRDGCEFCASVGVCTPKGCAEFTDLSPFIQLTTAAIKSPINLTATNGTYDTQVILN